MHNLKQQYKAMPVSVLEKTLTSGNLRDEEAEICKQVLEAKTDKPTTIEPGSAATSQPQIKNDYQTATTTASVVSGIGWLMCIIAVIIALAAVGGGSRLGLFALAPGLGLVTGGLLLVIAGQGSRALTDNANATRQILVLLQSKQR